MSDDTDLWTSTVADRAAALDYNHRLWEVAEAAGRVYDTLTLKQRLSARANNLRQALEHLHDA